MSTTHLTEREQEVLKNHPPTPAFKKLLGDCYPQIKGGTVAPTLKELIAAIPGANTLGEIVAKKAG